MVEIKIGERTYRVKNRILWEGLEKILTAMANERAGEMMRYIILYMCEYPRFSETEILKRDGMEMFQLATEIMEKTELKDQLDLFTKKNGIIEADEIKKKETKPSDLK